MSKLKVEDFDGLNVGPYSDKVSGVNDIAFLSKLEKHEAANGNRKGVLDAINKRQGELVEAKADAPKLGEVDIEVFKVTIEEMDDVKKLMETLAGARKAESPEMEQIIIERLAEVQKEDAKKPKEEIPAPPKKEEDKGLEEAADRPATKKESEASLKKNMSNDLKNVRLDLDKMVAKIQHHMGIDSTPEQPIGLAKAWLGVCLGELNNDSPYKNESKIKDRSQIPAPAERDLSNAFKAECVQFNNINTEIAVIGLRQDLLKVIEFLERIGGFGISSEFSIARIQAYVRAREARFALGVILGSLKV